MSSLKRLSRLSLIGLVYSTAVALGRLVERETVTRSLATKLTKNDHVIPTARHRPGFVNDNSRSIYRVTSG